MDRRRVVVTGMGTVNPVGHSVQEFWDGLMQKKTGIARIQRFDPEPFASRIGGEVTGWAGLDADRVDPREAKRMDRFAQFAVASAIEAVDNSGLDFSKEDVFRCGVIVGSGIGGLQELEDQHLRQLEKGPKRVSPFTVPKLMSNAGAGNISLLWGLRGPNLAVATACASAANSIGEAMRMIQHGVCDVAVSGGSEAALTQLGLGSFCALKGLSTRNDDPARASRPWDADRDGFVLAEGAGVIVIEELEHARARGADILAELVGYGATGDGYHITAPDPEARGAVRAMQQALKDASLTGEDISYVNAHGTSTGLGDIAEARALKKVFGDHAHNGLIVSSTKSLTGHLLGASGGIEIIACIKGILDGVIPATVNLDNPDEECDLDFCPHEPREQKIDVALSNSFGFGGHNACLLVRRFKG